MGKDVPASAAAPYRLYNIGSNNPINLSRYIECLEETLGIKAEKNLLPLQPGDVPATQADTKRLQDDTGYKPETTIETGVAKFVEWYKSYYQIA